MADVSALNRVAMLARNDELKSADALAKGQQQLRQANDQLEQLQRFRVEYEQRLRDMAASGMPVRQLQEYRKFLNSLNEAIGHQNQSVSRGDQLVREQRDEYLGRALRRGSLDQLIDRRQSEQQLRADNRDQQLSDDDFSRREVPD